MGHPLYSPNLAPNDFWLFLKMKSTLRGKRFQDIEHIQKTLTTALKAIPQQEFHKCFKEWLHPCTNCIAAQKGYFKGDSSQ